MSSSSLPLSTAADGGASADGAAEDVGGAAFAFFAADGVDVSGLSTLGFFSGTFVEGGFVGVACCGASCVAVGGGGGSSREPWGEFFEARHAANPSPPKTITSNSPIYTR